MKIIERCKKAFEDYKTVRLLKKMFKPLGIKVRWKFVQHIKATDTLVEFWSIEYHTLLFFKEKTSVFVPARIYFSAVMPYLQDVARQFMVPWTFKPTNNWLDNYSFVCDNPFLGCKSVEEMLIKADLMSK